MLVNLLFPQSPVATVDKFIIHCYIFGQSTAFADCEFISFRELNHATFLSHQRRPGVNISHTGAVVSSRCLN